jgi:hypothetical protein
MGIMVRERPQESALREVQKREYVCGELEPELQLPCGWEKCLDLKVCVGVITGFNSVSLSGVFFVCLFFLVLFCFGGFCEVADNGWILIVCVCVRGSRG